MKVFVDANIFIDIFNDERPQHRQSVEAYKNLIKSEAEIFTSCDLITTIYYIDSKRSKKQALLNVQNIIKTLDVISFSNEELEQVCELMQRDDRYQDLEDTLQYILAKKQSCDLFISNDKNFICGDIPVLTSKEFCARYNEV